MLGQNAEWLSLPVSHCNHGHIQHQYTHYIEAELDRTVFLDFKSRIACDDIVFEGFYLLCISLLLIIQCGRIKRHLAPF